MDFSYKKNDNLQLFKSLEENPDFGIVKPQNYIPLYNLYFELSQTNSNNINLNQRWQLNRLNAQETNNIFKCSVKGNDISGIKEDKKKETRMAYLKYSPLLDPLKYLMGKYDITDETLLNLPAFQSIKSNNKVRDCNNSAYVDSFFSFLSSKLLNEHQFVNGLDFYGSFLAEKTDFRFNIIDDIEMLNDSAFFRRNDKILYELEDVDTDEGNDDTRNYKKKLNISDELTADKNTILNLADITDITQLDTFCNTGCSVEELVAVNLDTDINLNSTKQSQSSSHSTSCSSRSSNTTDGEGSEAGSNDHAVEEADGAVKVKKETGVIDDGSEKDEASAGEAGEDASEDADDASGGSEGVSEADEEELLIAKIKRFPVQVIALEKCENTLDHLMSREDITDEQWDSIVLQIVFSLILFQKTFNFTHNDLHTNNVMYCETDKKFLYYKVNHVYYKVPTFGKLFKIIDFGRAIYKFRGQLLCSDSYHPDGDAATQYNCEPYINEKKPRLEPNMSFDLCRLGCALYDFLIDEPQTKIIQIMLNWVNDDKGRNILYKKNGDERYPDFKLYKMIARTVNKHVPIDVLSNAYFDKFIVPKKEIKTTVKVMDFDVIPCYV